MIDAAFLISQISRERGVSPNDLISTILRRARQENRDQANIGRPDISPGSM